MNAYDDLRKEIRGLFKNFIDIFLHSKYDAIQDSDIFSKHHDLALKKETRENTCKPDSFKK